jgi:hypothetical protein
VTYVLLGLGAYFVVELVRSFFTAPAWAWKIVALITGIGFALVKNASNWYLGFAVAGVALIAQRIDDLLLCRADESRFDLMKKYRQ